jgi:hypothetical protein
MSKNGDWDDETQVSEELSGLRSKTVTDPQYSSSRAIVDALSSEKPTRLTSLKRSWSYDAPLRAPAKDVKWSGEEVDSDLGEVFEDPQELRVEDYLPRLRARSFDDPMYDHKTWHVHHISAPLQVRSVASDPKHLEDTTTRIARASKEIVSVLQEEETLVHLYACATSNVLIGPQRLEITLCRLFHEYAEKLKVVAVNRSQVLASRLVERNAPTVARSIVLKYRVDVHATQGDTLEGLEGVKLDKGDEAQSLLDLQEYLDLGMFP